MAQQQTGPGGDAGPDQGPKLHVGLVHWSFPPCVGGVETHLWDFSRALAGRGHQVTVFTGSVGACSPCDGVRVLRHPLLDLSAERPDDDASMRRLCTWFQQVCTDPDAPVHLIHGHNLHHFSSAPARALHTLKQELGLVLLHTYHSIWRTPEDEELARTCAVWDVHHAVSDFLVKACTDVLGEAAHVDRTYLGVNTGAYLGIPDLDEAERHPVVLLPARLIPNKGAKVAIRMLKHLVVLAEKSPRADSPRPRLVLTDPFDTVDFHGERGSFRDELSRLVKEFGLSEGQDVEFRPAGIDDMRKLYEEATVVVYPSRFDEPMGLAPLEAMCAARPVVATGVGGLGEGGSTLVAPDADEEELASRFAREVWRLLVVPAEARAAGRRAREHVRDRFDLERVYVEPMLAEYGRLVRGTGQAGTSGGHRRSTARQHV